MIRFILTCIVVVGFLILSIPVLIAEWIIGKFNPHFKDISSLRIVQGAFNLCLKISGVEVTVIGEKMFLRILPCSISETTAASMISC